MVWGSIPHTSANLRNVMSRTIRRNRKTDRKDKLDKDFQYGAASCRHHGGCPYCEENRTHRHKRRAIPVFVDELIENPIDAPEWDDISEQFRD